METEPDSCLAPRLGGGGDGKETMTFQSTRITCGHIFFTQLAGRELLGVVAIDRWGKRFTLHENAHAEMVASKKNPRVG